MNKFKAALPVALAAIVAAGWFLLNGSGDPMKKLLSHDREILKGGGKDVEIYSALLRLGARRDPLAREAALNRLRDPSMAVRMAVATALGNYSDEETFGALVQLSRDLDKGVRARALTSFGSRDPKKAAPVLHEVIKRPGLSPEERIGAGYALFQVERTDSVRDEVMSFLVKYAADPDRGICLRAVTTAMSLSPKDPRLVSILHRAIGDPVRGYLQGIAVRHLAALRDPWLKKELPSLLKSANADARLAALQSLGLTCPPDRMDLLEGALKTESEPRVKQAADELLKQLRERDPCPPAP
jgi:HEAT repeat protein